MRRLITNNTLSNRREEKKQKSISVNKAMFFFNKSQKAFAFQFLLAEGGTAKVALIE